MSLFKLPPDTPDLTYQKLSAGRRRTIRQKALIARGVHPVVRLPLSGDPDATCGNCTNVYPTGLANRRYWKCSLVAPTGGPGTDIRLSWPGCERHDRNLAR